MTESPEEHDEPRIYKALKRLVLHRPLPIPETPPAPAQATPEMPWWADEEDDTDPLGPDFNGALGR